MRLLRIEDSVFPKSLLISVIIHAIILVGAVALSRYIPAPQYGSNGILEMSFDNSNSPSNTEETETPTEPSDETPQPAEKQQETQNPVVQPAKNSPVPVSNQTQKPTPAETAGKKGVIAGAFDAVDSTLLTLEYKENTLNVRIRYSAGWSFLDNNEKSKLDAVTFWNPSLPNSPWVQLKVTDKYLFRESRYKHKEEFKDYTAYYNDEEETEGEVKFEIYLRTNSSEDYEITFRVKGAETFRQYRPVFMAMLKSFKFGLF